MPQSALEWLTKKTHTSLNYFFFSFYRKSKMLGWLSTSVNGLYNTFSGQLHVTRDDNSEKMVLVLIIIEEICHKLVWTISSTRKLDRFWNRLGKLYRYCFVTFITVKGKERMIFFRI